MDLANNLAGFGDRLKQARKRAGLTPSQLGALCDPPVNRDAVLRFEGSRERLPSLPKLATLAHALKVSVCWLGYGIQCNAAAHAAEIGFITPKDSAAPNPQSEPLGRAPHTQDRADH